MITNCDVTILNKYIENRESKYKRYIIKNVHWEDSIGINELQIGIIKDIDNSTIYIPFTSGKDYVKPKQYKGIGFTLRDEDYIIKGIVDEDLPIKKLEEKYDDVRKITKVDTYDYGSKEMQHWRVGAR